MDEDAVLWIFNELLDAVADAIFTDHHNGLPPWDHSLDCDESNPNAGQITFNLVFANCKAFYSVIIPGNPTTLDDDYEEVHWVACSQDACCIKEVSICWDAAIGAMRRSESTSSTGTAPNCENYSPSVPSNANYVSPCRLDCLNP